MVRLSASPRAESVIKHISARSRRHQLAAILCALGVVLFGWAMPSAAAHDALASARLSEREGPPVNAPVSPTITSTVGISPTVSPTPTGPQLQVRVNQTDDSKFPQLTGYVSVTDSGGAPITGLSAKDLALLEDARPVAQFDVSNAVNTQEPLSVALVIDISGSMQGKSLDYARQAAVSFLDTLAPRDVVALISFSGDVKVNQPFTTTKTIVAKGIENLRAAGDTALYDAVAAAADGLGQLAPGRKLAVLLTDGEDTSSKRSLDAALATVAARRVPVFAVGLGDQVDQKVLEAIATRSGGSAILAPSPVDLLKAYRTVGDQLRSQYVVRFVSGIKADRAEHRLAVRVAGSAGSGEGQGVFVARPNPPWLDVVAPKAAQVVTTTQRIEVNAQPGAPGATVQQIDFAVDGQALPSAKAPPYAALLDAPNLAAGQHVLRVTALDSAGNSTTHEISFSVRQPAPVAQSSPTPEPAPTPVPTPEPEPDPAPQPASNLPILAGGGLAFLIVLGLAVVRKRRHSTTTCGRCGTIYSGVYCPTCALEDRELLRRRLHEVTGTRYEPPKGTPPK